MFFHVLSFSIIFHHVLSFSFIFYHFCHFLSFFFHFLCLYWGAQNLIFLGLNFVTISLDSSYVKNQFLGPSRVVGTPLGPLLLFSYFFFSRFFVFFLAFFFTFSHFLFISSFFDFF